VLRRLKFRVRRVRPEIADDWILHQDNAPSHTSFVASEVLAKNKIATMPQPPYSSDLAPSDFFFGPRMKSDMKGDRSGTVEEVHASFEEHPRVRVPRRQRGLEKPVAAMHQRRRVLF